MEETRDTWASGDAYEPYVGRWSRLVAREFLGWLAVPPGGRWLDLGCGTGALSAVVLELADPGAVVGVDPAPGFVAYAQAQIRDPRATFTVGDAGVLTEGDSTCDAVVARLVLNFVPDAARAVTEMARVTRPGGLVAAYVWDYSDRMDLMRYFWNAAVALDPAVAELDEGRRFPLCRPGRLGDLFRRAGLDEVQVRAIDVPTHFRDFDDYWSPLLGGQAPAPTYAMSLTEERRTLLRERIRADLPYGDDGSIALVARAWAVKGRR